MRDILPNADFVSRVSVASVTLPSRGTYRDGKASCDPLRKSSGSRVRDRVVLNLTDGAAST